jgi:hypothetical protein
VRPKKIVLDFQKGQSLGPVAEILKSDIIQEGNKDSVGELSVTLVDARKLAYVLFGTFIYSKKNNILLFLVMIKERKLLRLLCLAKVPLVF